MKRRSRWLALVALLTTVVAALALALPATAHNPVHWLKLTPGTSSSVRSTSYDHGTFRITIVAYFGK
jgi:uncharacterized protein involved in exopolysaccharide biosynthesis